MLLSDFTWEILLSPFGVGAVAIVCTFSWLIVMTVSESISQATTKIMIRRNDTEFKLELISRGYSSDEIVRIVEAGRDAEERSAPDSAKSSSLGHASPHATPVHS